MWKEDFVHDWRGIGGGLCVRVIVVLLVSGLFGAPLPCTYNFRMGHGMAEIDVCEKIVYYSSMMIDVLAYVLHQYCSM